MKTKLPSVTLLGEVLSLNADEYYTRFTDKDRVNKEKENGGIDLFAIPPHKASRPNWTAGIAWEYLAINSIKGYGATLEEAELDLINKFKDFKEAAEKDFAATTALILKKDRPESFYFGGLTFVKEKDLTSDQHESYISLFANFSLERRFSQGDVETIHWRVVPLGDYKDSMGKGEWCSSVREAIKNVLDPAREHRAMAEEQMRHSEQIHKKATSWIDGLYKVLNA